MQGLTFCSYLVQSMCLTGRALESCCIKSCCCYDILYLVLHLGSNDVCCKDSDFYRVCTEIHVVLCEILPRDFDVRMFPRWPLSWAQLMNYCQWIRSANSMLWELSHHVPSVR
ncbi:hypothetical protein DPMN_110583 [Dreissena polymorpha]|uniref:Uncharacterized protein n=1 Tax=Dreissena polymorpha TaxID=45954 RepID=A0A9D4KCC2_DREPO|nr:hypothetical protein DPMN_110583 [Dreissena polymorpha]